MQMLIKNAKLRDREELVNILIDGGKIVDIGVGLTAEAETVIDAEGNLTTASYIDPHIHLDKVNVLDVLPKNQSGTLKEAIEMLWDKKRNYVNEDILARGGDVVEREIKNGVLNIRTHIDVDTITGLKAEGRLATLLANDFIDIKTDEDTSDIVFGDTTSTLTLTFTEDSHLSFAYKVSSEARYDKCTIKLGSTILVDGESGEQDWKGLEVDAKKGDKLTVEYKKDSSGDKNDDCVYLRGFSAGEALVVTFHANNGTEDTATQKIFGGQGTLMANPFTCAGKIFAGWAAAPDGAVQYEDGAAITLDKALDLYAVWADAYTVTLKNGQDVYATILVPQNTAIGSRLPADPAQKGYTLSLIHI